MNHHARRLARDLEALGFNRAPDRDTRTGRAWTHPKAPDDVIKVTDHMTDNAITFIRKKAERISDASTAGTRAPLTIKERAIIRRRRETAHEARVRAEREARAAEAEARHQANEAARQRALRDREIRDLMMPGHGR